MKVIKKCKAAITKSLITAYIIIFCMEGYSQSAAKDYPVIGQPIPDFTLTNVHHYSKTCFTPNDIKGKWLILDFWNKTCSGCIKAFPKVNELQEEFKDHVQFLLVARNDQLRSRDIEQVYERYRKKLGLNLAIAFDTTLIKQFGIDQYPWIIVVDPENKVYAITGGHFLSRENLQALIDNKKPSFLRFYGRFDSRNTQYYNQFVKWKYWVEEDEAHEFIYRSVLSRNETLNDKGFWHIDWNVAQGFYQIQKANLKELYNLAYLGEEKWHRYDSLYTIHWANPILELDDPSKFESDYSTSKGFYNYSLIVPKEKSSKDYLMDVMQRDLKNYFGYEVVTESRTMPYWKLRATGGAKEKLKSKSAVKVDQRGATGAVLKRIPMALVISLVEEYNSDGETPFLDETGIKDLIDIKFEAVMTDIEDVKKALAKHGLILEKSTRPMQVLVIRDEKKR